MYQKRNCSPQHLNCRENACKTTHHIANQALTAPVSEAGGGIFQLQHRLDAKLLQTAELRLCSEEINGHAARSRLRALQETWATPDNPLDCEPGTTFARDGEARKAHFFALVAHTAHRYGRRLRLQWPAREYNKGPPLRSVMKLSDYDKMTQSQSSFWQTSKMYVGQVCNSKYTALIPFPHFHTAMGWKVPRNRSSTPVWYKLLQQNLCLPNSHNLRPAIRRRLPPARPTALSAFIRSRNDSPTSEHILSAPTPSPDPLFVRTSLRYNWFARSPIVIYTDGSHYGSSLKARHYDIQRSGFAWAIENPDAPCNGSREAITDDGHAYGRVPGIQSCYKGELFAIAHALKSAPPIVNLVIRSDSQAALIVCQRQPTWRSLRHRLSSYLRCLVQYVHNLLEERSSYGATTIFQWTKGHKHPMNKRVDAFAKAGASMPWTREDTRNHLTLSPCVWIDANTRQPLEHSIKLDVKMKGLMQVRLDRAAHPRQGMYFRETGVISAQEAGKYLRVQDPVKYASAPRPERPGNIHAIVGKCYKYNSGESRNKQLFLMRLTHRTLPTLHWLNQVKGSIYTTSKCPACNQEDTIEHIFSPFPNVHCHVYAELHSQLQRRLTTRIKSIALNLMTEPFLTSLIPRFSTSFSIKKAEKAHHSIYFYIRLLWSKHQEIVKPILAAAQNTHSTLTPDVTHQAMAAPTSIAASPTQPS